MNKTTLLETDIRIYKILYYPKNGEPMVEEFPVQDKEHIIIDGQGFLISILNNKTEIMNDPCKSGIVRIDIEWRQALLALGKNNEI